MRHWLRSPAPYFFADRTGGSHETFQRNVHDSSRSGKLEIAMTSKWTDMGGIVPIPHPLAPDPVPVIPVPPRKYEMPGFPDGEKVNPWAPPHSGTAASLHAPIRTGPGNS